MRQTPPIDTQCRTLNNDLASRTEVLLKNRHGSQLEDDVIASHNTNGTDHDDEVDTDVLDSTSYDSTTSRQDFNDTDKFIHAAFLEFCKASSLTSILETFSTLCSVVDIKSSRVSLFYPKLKQVLCRSWRAKSLFAKLDKKLSQPIYFCDNSDIRVCDGLRVMVVGGGPCGLRTAVEAQMLGARVVVVEKRSLFSRNNILHLWPFTIHDLKRLGAKIFYAKFCIGSINHISIRALQMILLKVALCLGVEMHHSLDFDSAVPPTTTPSSGWTASFKNNGETPNAHNLSNFAFDVLIGAKGNKSSLPGFQRNEFRGKLAIAITANFVNLYSHQESLTQEISGIAFIYNQTFFNKLFEATGIALENIVYYKDQTHYFVMTAKKQSLLERGVFLSNESDAIRLLSPSNVDQKALQSYALDAANFALMSQKSKSDSDIPTLQYAITHHGTSDVAIFDFTSMFQAENSTRVVERKGSRLIMSLVGDALLEPFWPMGTGAARGFLSALDTCWMLRCLCSGTHTLLQAIAERESIFRVLPQTTSENLSKSYDSYSIDPITRYQGLNTRLVHPKQIFNVVDTDNNLPIIEELSLIEKQSGESTTDNPLAVVVANTPSNFKFQPPRRQSSPSIFHSPHVNSSSKQNSHHKNSSRDLKKQLLSKRLRLAALANSNKLGGGLGGGSRKNLHKLSTNCLSSSVGLNFSVSSSSGASAIKKQERFRNIERKFSGQVFTKEEKNNNNEESCVKQYRLNKKPRDLHRAIGRIDCSQWSQRNFATNSRMCDQNESKRTKRFSLQEHTLLQFQKHAPPFPPLLSEGSSNAENSKKTNKVPKWSKEAFDDKFNAMKLKLESAVSPRNRKSFPSATGHQKSGSGSNKGHNRQRVRAVSTINAPPIAMCDGRFAQQNAVFVVPETCHFCEKKVYAVERMCGEGLCFHRSCFRCQICGVLLRPNRYVYQRVVRTDDASQSKGTFWCLKHGVDKSRRGGGGRPIDSKLTVASDISAGNLVEVVKKVKKSEENTCTVNGGAALLSDVIEYHDIVEDDVSEVEKGDDLEKHEIKRLTEMSVSRYTNGLAKDETDQQIEQSKDNSTAKDSSSVVKKECSSRMMLCSHHSPRRTCQYCQSIESVDPSSDSSSVESEGLEDQGEERSSLTTRPSLKSSTSLAVVSRFSSATASECQFTDDSDDRSNPFIDDEYTDDTSSSAESSSSSQCVEGESLNDHLNNSRLSSHNKNSQHSETSTGTTNTSSSRSELIKVKSKERVVNRNVKNKKLLKNRRNFRKSETEGSSPLLPTSSIAKDVLSKSQARQVDLMNRRMEQISNDNEKLTTMANALSNNNSVGNNSRQITTTALTNRHVFNLKKNWAFDSKPVVCHVFPTSITCSSLASSVSTSTGQSAAVGNSSGEIGKKYTSADFLSDREMSNVGVSPTTTSKSTKGQNISSNSFSTLLNRLSDQQKLLKPAEKPSDEMQHSLLMNTATTFTMNNHHNSSNIGHSTSVKSKNVTTEKKDVEETFKSDQNAAYLNSSEGLKNRFSEVVPLSLGDMVGNAVEEDADDDCENTVMDVESIKHDDVVNEEHEYDITSELGVDVLPAAVNTSDELCVNILGGEEIVQQSATNTQDIVEAVNEHVIDFIDVDGADGNTDKREMSEESTLSSEDVTPTLQQLSLKSAYDEKDLDNRLSILNSVRLSDSHLVRQLVLVNVHNNNNNSSKRRASTIPRQLDDKKLSDFENITETSEANIMEVKRNDNHRDVGDDLEKPPSPSPKVNAMLRSLSDSERGLASVPSCAAETNSNRTPCTSSKTGLIHMSNRPPNHKPKLMKALSGFFNRSATLHTISRVKNNNPSSISGSNVPVVNNRNLTIKKSTP